MASPNVVQSERGRRLFETGCREAICAGLIGARGGVSPGVKGQIKNEVANGIEKGLQDDEILQRINDRISGTLNNRSL